jgi:hypothetical protein
MTDERWKIYKCGRNRQFPIPWIEVENRISKMRFSALDGSEHQHLVTLYLFTS